MTNLELFADVEDSAGTALELREHLEGLIELNQQITLHRDTTTQIYLDRETTEQIRTIVVNMLSRQLSETVNRLKNEVEGL